MTDDLHPVPDQAAPSAAGRAALAAVAEAVALIAAETVAQLPTSVRAVLDEQLADGRLRVEVAFGVQAGHAPFAQVSIVRVADDAAVAGYVFTLDEPMPEAKPN